MARFNRAKKQKSGIGSNMAARRWRRSARLRGVSMSAAGAGGELVKMRAYRRRRRRSARVNDEQGRRRSARRGGSSALRD